MRSSKLALTLVSARFLFLFVAVPGCSGGSTTTGTSGGANGAGNTAGLDGTWDVTSAGGDTVGPSELVVSNGTVRGFVVLPQEGRPASVSGCTIAKDRLNVEVNIQGDALSGTFTLLKEYDGTGCPANKSTVTSLSGTRTSNGGPTAGLSGTWDVQFDREPVFVAEVDGLSGKATDKVAKGAGAEPAAQFSVAGGILSMTSTTRSFSLSARKR
jgi:hypothetical protein